MAVQVNNKVVYRWLAIIAVVAVVAIVVVVVVPPMMRGANQAASGGSQSASGEAAATAENASIPAEAQAFVTEYGSRYADPVSTYYAEQAYIAAGNKGRLMPDIYISNYDASAQMNSVSPLGFEWYSVSPDAKIDLTTAMKVFNEYTAKEVSIYMNALSKNPTPEAIAIIDNEFMNYCSDTNNANRFTEDDEYIATLMETAKGVVAKYGSAANYTVAQGSTVEGRPNSTYFDKDLVTLIQGQDEKGITTKFSNKVNLAVDVEVFNGESATKDEVTIKDAELFVVRHLDGYRISIGQVIR